MAWNGSHEENKNLAKSAKGATMKSRSSSALKFLVFALPIALATVLVIILLQRESTSVLSENRQSDRHVLISDAQPAKPVFAVPPKERKLTEEELHPGMVKAPNGVWHPKGIPYLLSWKKPHVVVTNKSDSAESIATCSTEQILLQIFSRDRGDMPLPLPATIPESDIARMAEILINKPPVDESKDSEEIKRQKSVLNEVKTELQKFLKDGGIIEDFICDYHDELERCYFMKFDAQIYLNQMERDGESPELIHDMAKQLNKKLADEGIENGVIDPSGIEEDDESE